MMWCIYGSASNLSMERPKFVSVCIGFGAGKGWCCYESGRESRFTVLVLRLDWVVLLEMKIVGNSEVGKFESW
jgi:hypothetical protein